MPPRVAGPGAASLAALAAVAVVLAFPTVACGSDDFADAVDLLVGQRRQREHRGADGGLVRVAECAGRRVPGAAGCVGVGVLLPRRLRGAALMVVRVDRLGSPPFPGVPGRSCAVGAGRAPGPCRWSRSVAVQTSRPAAAPGPTRAGAREAWTWTVDVDGHGVCPAASGGAAPVARQRPGWVVITWPLSAQRRSR